MFLKNRNKIRNILIAILPGLVVAGFWGFADSPQRLTIIDADPENPAQVIIDADEEDKETIIGTQLFELIEPVWPDAQGYIYREGQHEEMWVEGYRIGLGAQGKLPDHLYAFAEQSPSIQERTWVINQPLNLTGYDSIKIDALTETTKGKALLVVSGNKDGSHDQEVAAEASIITGGEREIFTLDVSGLSGEYYIRIHVRTAGRGNSNYYRCYKVWLE